MYLYYTNPNPGGASWANSEHNQLSRFTVNDSNPLQPTFTNEAPILDWNNLSSAQNHNGGAIHFGIDGMLYADAGDNVQTFVGPDNKTYRVSQSLDTLLGKQLRINVASFNSGVATRDDTTVGHLIPSDNPFVGTATGINQMIYVLGLRNPFTFAVQPGTGRMLINDVGENTWEEIDDDIAGGNYGWSGGNTDGFGNPPPAFAAGTYHDPLLAYGHTAGSSLATGSAIVGGVFYDPANVEFPSSYVGMYFYEDLSSGFIRYFNPNDPNTAAHPDGDSVSFATGTPGNLHDLAVNSAGNLYYLSGTDGSIRRISFVASTVRGQDLFYAGSSHFDTTGTAAAPLPFSDDNAIATDKSAYIPGSGTATAANVSSYSQGINGIMIDLSGAHGTITANDFVFKIGNNNTPSSWATAPAPVSVTVRAGAGVNGSDRIELIWANGAIKHDWLEVQMLANTDTKLTAPYTFFFGSAAGDDLVGETTTAFTNSTDDIGARNHPGSAVPITNIYDYDKDGFVNSSDQLVARSNSGSIRFINLGNPPSAPDGGECDARRHTRDVGRKRCRRRHRHRAGRSAENVPHRHPIAAAGEPPERSFAQYRPGGQDHRRPRASRRRHRPNG